MIAIGTVRSNATLSLLVASVPARLVTRASLWRLLDPIGQVGMICADGYLT